MSLIEFNKLKILLCTILAFVLVPTIYPLQPPAPSQGGWIVQNPYPTTENYNDLYLFGPDSAIVVGASGVIAKTNDGGSSWHIPDSATDKYLRSVQFVDREQGWICGDYGTILTTSDGGMSWTAQVSNTALHLHDIGFSDPFTGWAVGDSGIILKTTDAGNTWEIQTGDPNRDWYALQVAGDGELWVGGGKLWNPEPGGMCSGSSGDLIHSLDGGTNWEQVRRDDVIIKRLQFTSDSTGWFIGTYVYCLGGPTMLYRTRDGGLSWEMVLDTLNHFGALHFANESYGWCSSSYGRISRTEDGGNSWQHLTLPFQVPPINAIQFIDTTHGWAVGDDGAIIKTEDGGLNWSQEVPVTYERLHAMDVLNNTIYIAGYKSVFRSVDYGISWQEIIVDSILEFRFQDVELITDSVIWVVGWEAYPANIGFAYQTSDGGITWDRVLSYPGREFYEIVFINSSIGILVGSGGMILKSDDGGVNWTEQNSGTSKKLKAVTFINEMRGWIAGDEGIILGTTNGGTSWEIQGQNAIPEQNYVYLNDIFFLNDQIGWISGWPSALLKTTNGGASWETAPGYQYFHDNYESFFGVYFINDSTGWLAGYNIFKTTDGGFSWGKQQELPYTLFDIAFLNADTGWAVGHNGLLLMTTNGGGEMIPLAIKAAHYTPAGFELEQNFPNPFNPATTIRYELPQASEVLLLVYDLLGREVARLVDGTMEPGYHKVQWNGRGFASGIYIAQLRCATPGRPGLVPPGYSKSIKMVLLK